MSATTTLPAPPSRARACGSRSIIRGSIAMVVTMATFMEVLDTSIANVALPHIAGNLSASTDESAWVLSSYLVANAVILPISAWLATRFGRKRFYMTCVVLFGISSLLCGLAPNLVHAGVFPRDCRAWAAADWRPANRPFWPTLFPRKNAAWRSRFTAWRWCWRRRSVRRWADISPIISTGDGFSLLMCRWPSSR